MDKVELGERVARARELAGLTQGGLGRAVGLDRTAVVRLEKGERKLSVPELATIAEVLRRPLAFFVEPAPPAVVSRRTDETATHDTTAALDSELEQFASDALVLLDMNLLDTAQRPEEQTPGDHADAERLAERARRRAGVDGPIADLGVVCERLGLLTYSAALGPYGPDGGCVEVTSRSATLGVTVINGDAAPGRRRMTLAHELGHWLTGDAYDSGATLDAEKMLNSFAIHFLAPRAGVSTLWTERGGSPRDRAIAVSATYRLSWTATVSQLHNLDLITSGRRASLEAEGPAKGDFLRLRLGWSNELDPPHLSPAFAAACLDGYVTRRLTGERTVELLRGTLPPDELPRRNTSVVDDLRRSFDGHGG